MAKVLVIGGGGFVGKHLVEALNTWHDVTVADKKIKEKIRGVSYLKCDITKLREVKKLLKKYKYVYHLAALLDESLPRKKLYDVNVGGTVNILEACKKSKIKRLVYISTAGVMGDVEKKSNEKSKYNPETNYEKSKALAEVLVKEYYKRYEIPVVIIRSALVYGPNNYWLKILKKAQKPFPVLGSGENKVHFVYIKNLIKALIKARTKGKDGEIYLIADKKPVTYNDFYKIVREELGVEKEPAHIPVIIGNLIAFFYKLFGKKSLISKEHIKRLTRNRWYDIKKAKKDLGYKAKYDLRKGIKETIKYFKKQDAL